MGLNKIHSNTFHIFLLTFGNAATRKHKTTKAWPALLDVAAAPAAGSFLSVFHPPLLPPCWRPFCPGSFVPQGLCTSYSPSPKGSSPALCNIDVIFCEKYSLTFLSEYICHSSSQHSFLVTIVMFRYFIE